MILQKTIYTYMYVYRLTVFFLDLLCGKGRKNDTFRIRSLEVIRGNLCLFWLSSVGNLWGFLLFHPFAEIELQKEVEIFESLYL